ncbi:uncharacterized protein METZ01_LOCUS415057 [marine metagenome]|uniref:Uncharacterized protein n=1 Tax=marine metagenome TaxID=408172 RepID=A0A382WU36_9ZZZZ
MKYLLTIIVLSFSFASYYEIGDTVNVEEHLNHPIEICHGSDENNAGDVLSLSDNAGRITVIGLEIPW